MRINVSQHKLNASANVHIKYTHEMTHKFILYTTILSTHAMIGWKLNDG